MGPVFRLDVAAVDELRHAHDRAQRLGRRPGQPEPGRRVALGDAVAGRGVQQQPAPVTRRPGADLDGLGPGEDEVDPRMADGESFHSADEASRGVADSKQTRLRSAAR